MVDSVDFVAVDVETANSDLASVCQIGIVTVRSGVVQDVWSQLVDPEDEFDDMNVFIHGITGDDVADAPIFRDLFAEVDSRLSGVVVSHSMFDHRALSRAAKKYDTVLDKPQWLDSARVVRRAWPDQYSTKGYGLKKVAANLDIDFKHHDAAEDARAVAEIMLRVLDEHSLGLDEWFVRVKQPIVPRSGPSPSQIPIRCDGNPDGEMFGEVIVFTGSLTVPRREAADMAAEAGCTVASDVTKNTTVLVIGDQDVRKLAGNEKSRKHRKTEELIRDGQSIRIVSEIDFLHFASGGGDDASASKTGKKNDD